MLRGIEFEDDASISSKSSNRYTANSCRTADVPIGNKITNPGYAKRKRIVTENNEEK